MMFGRTFFKVLLFSVQVLAGYGYCASNLPLYWEQAVVMIEKVEVDAQGTTFIIPHGTGFLYADSVLGLCLITNRHILDGRDSIFVRFNYKEDSVTTETTKFFREVCKLRNADSTNRWIGHRNERVDIAAVRLNTPNHAAQFRPFYSDRLKLFADLKVGEELFFYGFPLLIFGLQGQGDFPILRSGIVSIKAEKFTYFGNDILDSGTFLIDGFSFPGNSGSPVIVPFTNVEKAKVVGIVFGHIANERKTEIEISPFSISLPSGDSVPVKIPPHSISFRENVGLAKALCSDFIVETIADLRTRLTSK